MLTRSLSYFMLGFGFSVMVEAVETLVPQGDGTLAIAIANASAGDILILEGNYLGDIVIDKALMIRGSTSYGTNISGAITINAPTNDEVIIQSLDIAGTLTVNSGGDIKILDNYLLSNESITVTNYKLSEGDGKLSIIGNEIYAGTFDINVPDAYIIGNILHDVPINSNMPIWIVGNEINMQNKKPIEINTTGNVQLIANHIRLYYSPLAALEDYYAIYVNATKLLAVSNIIVITDGGGHSYSANGIYSTLTTNARIFNNIIDYKDSQSFSNASTAIHAQGNIGANMVLNMPTGIPINSNASLAENNLCFANSNNTVCGSNPITTNPQFGYDYSLGSGSPAIDAGLTETTLADMSQTNYELSRNDIGAYGGPWSIEKYDIERFSIDRLRVYLLFGADFNFDEKLQVQALGIARVPF